MTRNRLSDVRRLALALVLGNLALVGVLASVLPQAALVLLPEIAFLNDGPGKPVGINQHIGRRPLAAFGNSDGDLPMFQWTTAGSGPRFALLVHHTDAEREWAYDRASPFGRLDKALDEAKAKGWPVADMKNDWKVVYAAEKK